MTDIAAAEPVKKKSNVVMTAAAVVGLTIVGVAGGWVVGKMIAPPVDKPAAAGPAAEHAAPAPAAAEGGHGAAPVSLVKPLEPILANLAYPSDSMVRLELSLIFGEHVDDAMAAEIQGDILAYMRTVSLQQLQGPRGFSYLRDDLKERVKLRSQGKVVDVVFRTFVVE